MARFERSMLDFELYFFSEVLKLNAFHHGYWDPVPADGSVTLDEFRDAQSRYTSELVAAVPDGVGSVLDVGSGIGDSAKALARSGYDVVAISPDQNHAKYYADCDGLRLTFHRSKFEDFETDSRFDLLYFSESHNYIDRRVLLERSRGLTKPGGHVLICGTFYARDGESYEDDFDPADLDFVRDAEATGMDLVGARDITENVRPSMDLMNRGLTEFALPLVHMADAFLEAGPTIQRWALKLMLSRPRKSFVSAIHKHARYSDGAYFGSRIRYVRLLLQVPG